jgi:hypothetical protein
LALWASAAHFQGQARRLAKMEFLRKLEPIFLLLLADILHVIKTVSPDLSSGSVYKAFF